MSLENAYRESLYHCKILTREEEIAAFDRGDLNAIVESVLPLIFREAARICKYNQSKLPDVVSAGNLSVMRSVYLYDAHKSRFTTWSVNIARFAMINAYHNGRRKFLSHEHPNSLEHVQCRPESNWQDIADRYQCIDAALSILSERERSFLLRWANGESMEQIGESVSLTRSRIQQLIAKAISDIRANLAARGIA